MSVSIGVGCCGRRIVTGVASRRETVGLPIDQSARHDYDRPLSNDAAGGST